ncbi:MAG: site-2 protease family protein [Rhizobiaceae bacterium]
MVWSFPLVTIAGTQLRVHVTFFLILLWFAWLYYQDGGTAAAAVEGIFYVLAVFACVVLHEFGHVLVARRFGIRTPDITLLPIGGLARLERMPEEPRQEFLIAIAGPLVNVVIAAIIFSWIGLTTDIEQLIQVENPRAGFLVKLAGINVFLVVFNLIPAFPMDGGRVLRALLATRMTWAQATQIAATTGQGLAFVLGFLGLLYNPILIFIAIFVYLAAGAEAQNAQLRDVAASLMVSDVMVTEFRSLQLGTTVDDAVEALMATSQSEFPVTDADGHFAGLLTRDAMIRLLRTAGPDAPIDSAVVDIPQMNGRQPLRECLRLMQEGGAAAVAVTDRAGALVGLMTRENLGEMLMVRSAAPGGFSFRRRRQG